MEACTTHTGVCGGTVGGGGTALQAGSRVRFLLALLVFFISLFLLAVALGSTQPLTQMSTTGILWR